MAASHILPETLERLSPEERKHVTLRVPPAIQTFLCDAIKKDVTLTVFYGRTDFFVSHLFESTPTQCLMDAPSSLIKPPLKPDDVLYVMGTLDQIPFHFVVHAYTLTRWEGFPAISFSAPTALIRLQRRSTFRLVIPLEFHLTAYIIIDDKRHEGRIADISTGGVQLTDLSLPWLQTLSRGQSVLLALELDGIQLTLDMLVTNVQALHLFNGSVIGQLCLRFKDLPPRVENRIARFLMRNELRFTR